MRAERVDGTAVGARGRRRGDLGPRFGPDQPTFTLFVKQAGDEVTVHLDERLDA